MTKAEQDFWLALRFAIRDFARAQKSDWEYHFYMIVVDHIDLMDFE